MFDKKTITYIGAGKQTQGRRVLNQQNFSVFTKVSKPGACVVGIGNRKRLYIDLRGKACKEKITAFAPGCKIVRVRPEQSLFCARPLTSH